MRTRIYGGLSFQPSQARDRTFGAFEDGDLVALGRLQHHADGALEVGGFWVADALRGRGCARRMVSHVLDHAPSNEIVWCVPFTHLASFYLSFGMERFPREGEVPASIRKKLSDCSSLAACGATSATELLRRIPH